jgi:hypothetical protein
MAPSGLTVQFQPMNVLDDVAWDVNPEVSN